MKKITLVIFALLYASLMPSQAQVTPELNSLRDFGQISVQNSADDAPTWYYALQIRHDPEDVSLRSDTVSLSSNQTKEVRSFDYPIAPNKYASYLGADPYVYSIYPDEDGGGEADGTLTNVYQARFDGTYDGEPSLSLTVDYLGGVLDGESDTLVAAPASLAGEALFSPETYAMLTTMGWGLSDADISFAEGAYSDLLDNYSRDFWLYKQDVSTGKWASVYHEAIDDDATLLSLDSTLLSDDTRYYAALVESFGDRSTVGYQDSVRLYFDGGSAVVPEAETYALVLGLVMCLGFIVRRRFC